MVQVYAGLVFNKAAYLDASFKCSYCNTVNVASTMTVLSLVQIFVLLYLFNTFTVFFFHILLQLLINDFKMIY